MAEKTVLITGSSKGIGKELALSFAREGYNLIITGRDEIALQNLKKEIERLNHSSVEIIFGDLREKETIKKLTEISKQKNVTIFVSNAGVYLNNTIRETTEFELRNLMEVNFFAAFLLTKNLLPLLEKNSGTIVFINSLAGETPSDKEAAYCASKHALSGFAGSLQYDATRLGIKVLEVYSGVVATEMVKERKDPEKCIGPKEAADFICEVCKKDYPSMRIPKIYLNRRKY